MKCRYCGQKQVKGDVKGINFYSARMQEIRVETQCPTCYRPNIFGFKLKEFNLFEESEDSPAAVGEGLDAPL